MMDGVAVRSQDLRHETDRVQIIHSVMAGDPRHDPLAPRQAVRIMTGGMIPDGCDAVIPQELAHISDAGTVRSQVVPQPGDHLMRRGELIRAGDTVLATGTLVRAAQWALLWEIGCRTVLARPPIRAAVLATGSELANRIDEATDGRIVNTNGPMLAALLQDFGCNVTSLGVAADDETVLRQKIEAGLQFDLLITSGGVSVGERDLVPETMAALGVHSWFHRVRMKPGKPLWFGTTESGTVVLGLPGNPVSSFVGCQLFVRTAVAVLADDSDMALVWQRVPSRARWQGKADRETFWPARLHATVTSEQSCGGGVELLPWKGSSDLRTLAAATGLVRIPVGTSAIETGRPVDYIACS